MHGRSSEVPADPVAGVSASTYAIEPSIANRTSRPPWLSGSEIDRRDVQQDPLRIVAVAWFWGLPSIATPLRHASCDAFARRFTERGAASVSTGAAQVDGFGRRSAFVRTGAGIIEEPCKSQHPLSRSPIRSASVRPGSRAPIDCPAGGLAEAILDSVAEAILLFDPHTDAILDVNRGAAALFDRPADALIGRPLDEFVPRPPWHG